jgi:hypothetical protein
MCRAHQPYKLIINYLYDKLSRCNTLKNLLAYRSFLYIVDELFDDFIINIRIQQNTPHFTQRFGDVGFCDFSLAAKLLKNKL